MTHPALWSQLGAVVFSGVMGTALIVLRLRAAKKPTSLRKIVIPPLGMSTGFLMFAFPPMRIPWLWGTAAFAIGLLIFAFPLIVTTRMERREEEIYIKRSKAFVFILAILFAVRFALRGAVEPYLTVPQTGALFYLLAFGMILPWRLAMLGEYLALKRNAEATERTSG